MYRFLFKFKLKFMHESIYTIEYFPVLCYLKVISRRFIYAYSKRYTNFDKLDWSLMFYLNYDVFYLGEIVSLSKGNIDSEGYRRLVKA